MHASNEAELARNFHMMRALGGITVFGSEILEASLNINDWPQMERFVGPLMRHLYAQVCESGINFDVVVAIPTGGVRWAEEFIKIISVEEGRRVRLYKLHERIMVEGFAVPWWQTLRRSKRVLIIDDTVAGGGTSRLAQEAVCRAGCDIAAFAFPVAVTNEGLSLWRSKKIPVFTAFDSAYVKALRKKEESM